MTLILTTTCAWIVWVAALNSARWQFTNPVTQVIGTAGALLVVRPTVLALGLDTPFPDDEWLWRDSEAALIRTQWAAMLFIATLAIAARLFRTPAVSTAPANRLTARTPRRRLPSRWVPTNARVARWLPALTVIAVAATAPYWVRYGGLQGLTIAAKGRTLEGTARLLRTPAVVTAYLGMSLAVATDAEGRRPWLRRGLLTYAICAVVSYSWGARDAVIFPLLLPLLVMASRPTRLSLAAVRRAVSRTPVVVVVLTLVFGGGFALRALRDVSITGNVQSSIAGQSVVRRVSVATNQTQFDAFMLVVEDSPEPLPRGGWDAIAAGARSMVPAPLRPDGPVLVAPALQVAQFYEPSRRNGWPLTAAGDWFWALGWAGVALGGALSGIVFTRLDSWRRRQRTDATAAMNAYVLIATTTVALGGIGLSSTARVLSIGAPVMLIGAVVALMPNLGRPRLERFTVPDERPLLERTRDWTIETIGQIEMPPRLDTLKELRPLPAPDPAVDIPVARPERRPVRGDLAVTLGSNVFGVVVGLAVAVLSTRALGQTEFGRLSWAMTATYVGAAIATVGLGLAVVALDQRYEDPEQNRLFIGTSLNVTLVASTALAVVLSAGAVIAPRLVGDDFVDVAKLCGLLIVPTALLSVASAAFRTRGRFVEAAVTSEQVTRTAVLLALLLAVASGNRSATYVVVMAALYLMIASALPYAALRVSPATPIVEPLPTFLRRLVPFFLASVGATLIPQIGVVTLGLSRGADEVAILAAAVRVQMLCSLLAGATGRVIGPRIAKHRGPTTELTPFLRNASTFVFWSTLAIAAPFLLGGPWVIPLVFGTEFADAWAPLVVLMIGVLVNVGTGSSGQLLFNTGHERALSRKVVTAGLAYVPMSALGGWIAGPMGVAVSATVLVSALNVWQAWAALRWTGVPTWTHLEPRHVLRTARSMARGRSDG